MATLQSISNLLFDVPKVAQRDINQLRSLRRNLNRDISETRRTTARDVGETFRGRGITGRFAQARSTEAAEAATAGLRRQRIGLDRQQRDLNRQLKLRTDLESSLGELFKGGRLPSNTQSRDFQIDKTLKLLEESGSSLDPDQIRTLLQNAGNLDDVAQGLGGGGARGRGGGGDPLAFISKRNGQFVVNSQFGTGAGDFVKSFRTREGLNAFLAENQGLRGRVATAGGLNATNLSNKDIEALAKSAGVIRRITRAEGRRITGRGAKLQGIASSIKKFHVGGGRRSGLSSRAGATGAQVLGARTNNRFLSSNFGSIANRFPALKFNGGIERDQLKLRAIRGDSGGGGGTLSDAARFGSGFTGGTAVSGSSGKVSSSGLGL